MAIPPLNKNHVRTEYDAEKAIAYVYYSGELGAEDSAAAYAWLQDLLEEVGSESLYGEVFDFSDVSQFRTDNLIDARKHSRKMNLMMETYYFPVAMVVSTSMQEEILRGPMRVPEGNIRKRIVYSMHEALSFLDEWHHQEAGSA